MDHINEEDGFQFILESGDNRYCRRSSGEQYHQYCKIETFWKYDTFVKDKLTTQHKGLIIPIKKNYLLLFSKTQRGVNSCIHEEAHTRHLLHADVAVIRDCRYRCS